MALKAGAAAARETFWSVLMAMLLLDRDVTAVYLVAPLIHYPTWGRDRNLRIRTRPR